MNKLISIFRSSVCIALLVLAAAPAFAQKTVSGTAASKRPKSAEQLEMENYFHKISKPMVLPDVPDAGNAKFRFGIEHTEKNGLISVGMRYGTSSTPQQLIDFYKQSLLAQQWKLDMCSTTSVRAQKGERRLTINVMPKGSPDVATDFMLNYSYRGR